MNVVTRVDESTGNGNSFLKYGIAEFKVIGINPNLKELNALLGREAKEDQKEPEYLSEKDGKDRAKIVFWIQEVLTGWKTKLEFEITNEEAVTKNGNPIWVNVVGENAKVAKENLQKWFMEFYKSKDDKTVIGEKNFRKAKVGEAPIYEFMRAWLNRKTSTNVRMDWWNPECNILLDIKRIFRGDISEIKNLWKAEEGMNMTDSVVLAVYVDSYEKDNELKYAQKVWPYKIVAGYNMKKFNVCLQTDSWDSSKDTKKYKDELTGQYGISKGFRLESLREFKAEEFLEMTNETIRHSEGTSNSPTDTEY